MITNINLNKQLRVTGGKISLGNLENTLILQTAFATKLTKGNI